ncbi:MAG: Zn-dependent hydrolase [Pseudomonadota bacterium]
MRDNLTIDGARLWESLMEMAKIGPGIAGGNNRQTLTDADGEGRALFQAWCEAEGLTLGLDRLGTMFARREGTEPDLPPVYVGSHLDTQPTGGKYDGVLGVLAGLEIIRTLNAREIRTRHPIVVVNWTNEEGSRFAPSMVSSGVFAGAYTAEFALDLRDSEGLRWLRYTLTGRESHTGTTPMPARRNAGLGAARISMLVQEVAMAHQPQAVGAVAHLELSPNSPNIVPGQAVLTVDIRSPQLEILEEMHRLIDSGVADICADLGLEMSFESAGAFDPVTFDPDCVATVRRAAKRLGYSHREIVSGAGHDACLINRVAPTAMVFCPCVGGLSHNEAEEITPDWAEKGANVLFHAVVETAEIVD